MKLFLFGASILYLLGLKLTSKIEITPVFHHKTPHTESISTPATVTAPVEVKTDIAKTDSAEIEKTTGSKETAPQSEDQAK
jgi:hypothetical protein